MRVRHHAALDQLGLGEPPCRETAKWILTVVMAAGCGPGPRRPAASYLRNWGGAAADVTAVVTLGAPLDNGGESHLIGIAELRIVGTDVLGRTDKNTER